MRNDYDIDDEEDEGEGEEDDPTIPGHRDYDLSTAADYDYDQPVDDNKPWFLQRWVLLIVSLVLVISLLLPYIARF